MKDDGERRVHEQKSPESCGNGYDVDIPPMTRATCRQCGKPLSEQAKFCGQCGAVNEGPPVSHAAHTILHLPPEQGPAQAAPTPPVPVVPASGGAAHKRTMMGFAPATSAPVQTAPAVAAPNAVGPRNLHKTMLGMTAPTDAPVGRDETPKPNAAALRRTIVGVAVPGVAPTGEAAPRDPAPASPARDIPYVPPPAPLQEMPVPHPPRIVRRVGGLPLVAVGLVAAALVLVGGLTLALFWKGAAPIAAQPHTTSEGQDILSLRCDPKSCKDGTVVSLDGMKATFTSGEAELALSRPLRVGENVFALLVDRPGMGRDETLKLVVPVGYRVRADVTTIAGPRPSITIHVDAPPGTEVRIDDKPIELDANGAGAYAIDEAAATEGPADESRVVSVDIPYAVVQKGGVAEKGTASARVVVAPLRVDSPGPRAVVEDDHTLLAGRAAKGSTVTVDGANVPVGPEGTFETTVPLPALGDRVIEVRASTPTLAQRTVHASVTRVISLAEAAKQFERLQPIGYDAAMSDVAARTGQTIVVRGRVLDARSSAHRTLVLVDDKRGCAKGPCLARVIVGKDMALGHGDLLTAYGTVARAFTAPGGQTVPEIEAQFVIRPP